MGVHRCLPSLAEAFRIQPLDVQAQLVDVIAADVTVDRMEQHPLLHRRQRIQVGDLRRRHRQPIQLLLVQARQGKSDGVTAQCPSSQQCSISPCSSWA